MTATCSIPEEPRGVLVKDNSRMPPLGDSDGFFQGVKLEHPYSFDGKMSEWITGGVGNIVEVQGRGGGNNNEVAIQESVFLSSASKDSYSKRHLKNTELPLKKKKKKISTFSSIPSSSVKDSQLPHALQCPWEVPWVAQTLPPGKQGITLSLCYME